MADAREERWREHRLRTREALIDAAIRAIDDIGPNVSMREIAAEAKTVKPALYRHFVDKAGLNRAIGDRMRTMIVERSVTGLAWFEQPPGAMVRSSVTGYAEIVLAHPNVFRFLIEGHFGNLESAQTLEESRAVANEVAQLFRSVMVLLGGDPSEVETDAFALIGAVASATIWWMTGDSRRVPLEQFVDRVDRIIRAIVDGAAAAAGVSFDYDEPFSAAALNALSIQS